MPKRKLPKTPISGTFSTSDARPEDLEETRLEVKLLATASVEAADVILGVTIGPVAEVIATVMADVAVANTSDVLIDGVANVIVVQVLLVLKDSPVAGFPRMIEPLDEVACPR